MNADFLAKWFRKRFHADGVHNSSDIGAQNDPETDGTMPCLLLKPPED